MLSEPSEEESFRQPGDSEIHFLEYELDSERGGDILVTLEDPSCVMLTRNQHSIKPQGAPLSSIVNPKSKDIIYQFHNNNFKP